MSDHVASIWRVTHDGLCVQAHWKYVKTVLDMVCMQDFKPSLSSRVVKITGPGDREHCEKPQLYRKVHCASLFRARRRLELESFVRWMCKVLRTLDGKSWP